MIEPQPATPPRCPDGGSCHHRCGTGACFRVLYCAPLSSYGETWDEATYRAALDAKPSEPTAGGLAAWLIGGTP